MICKFCEKECKNDISLRNHQRLCKGNPDRQESNFKFVKEPWNKGLTKSDPRVAKNAENTSKALKGKPSKTIWTDEMRKSKSEWRKQLHIDHPEMHPNRRLAGNRNKMSYPEKVAYDHLTSKGVLFEHQKQVLGYFPDFVVGNVIIEIDGAYWHDKDADTIRDAKLTESGYIVHRIDSKENIAYRIDNILGLV